MSNDQLRCLLLRLEAMQETSHVVSTELRDGVNHAPLSPLTRSLLGTALSRVLQIATWSNLARKSIQEAMDADAQTPESAAVLLPYAANFCGDVESPDEAV